MSFDLLSHRSRGKLWWSFKEWSKLILHSSISSVIICYRQWGLTKGISPCGDVKGAVHHCWGLEPVRWPPGTTRYAHPDVSRLCGTLLQQRSRACFQGQFNILANYHISIIAVAIWVGINPLIISVCCFEIWKAETAAAKKTKWRYFIMWWMCRSQLVQCFGVVKLCVWWVFSLGDVKTTGADSRWRPYTHSWI